MATAIKPYAFPCVCVCLCILFGRGGSGCDKQKPRPLLVFALLLVLVRLGINMRLADRRANMRGERKDQTKEKHWDTQGAETGNCCR